MCSMHTKHFCWDGIAVIVIGSYSLFATGVPILPWMGPHVSYNSTWQLSSSARLQWQHVIIGQRTLTWWYMDVCINVYSTTVAPSPWVQNIHPFQLPGCDVSILISWPTELHWSLITLLHKICNHQIHSTSFAWLTVNKKSTCTIITNKNSWSSWQPPSSFLSSTSSIGFPLSRHPAKLIWWIIMNHGCSHPSMIQ